MNHFIIEISLKPFKMFYHFASTYSKVYATVFDDVAHKQYPMTLEHCKVGEKFIPSSYFQQYFPMTLAKYCARFALIHHCAKLCVAKVILTV